ncbi:uncharacterized protein BP5553_07473 [Venustampulla echinocandica]|uniref:P-loop containing nucleoside triphosphate hydrolase n=1 Tax=Venustampulla echinocandica TaxID=2656787 RepID=A0A370TGN0_9HELO|nr:uncharacterized protein BP5553_07473 [Venustampulla echinocandica]RDL34345.1 hypothetical protein BP5553_07473 [Venustampulla echinocandica]
MRLKLKTFWASFHPRKGKEVQEKAETKVIQERETLDEEDSVDVKLLLLGSGESGKTTFAQQIHLIHQGGYEKQARQNFRYKIFYHLNREIYWILQAMSPLETVFENDDNHRLLEMFDLYSTKIFNFDWDLNQPMSFEYFHAIKSLLSDKGFQLAILKSRQYTLDGLYFLTDLDRLAGVDYLPTDQDILHAYTVTSGINQNTINFGNFVYNVVETGGARSERKKLSYVCDNVDVIIFFIPLSAYNLTLREDRAENSIVDALAFFGSIVNSKRFVNTTFVLFFNKLDLFQQKLVWGIPIKKYFPDYHGKNTDVHNALEFFIEKFRKVVDNPAKELHIHIGQATDTDTARNIMASIQDLMIEPNLSKLKAF